MYVMADILKNWIFQQNILHEAILRWVLCKANRKVLPAEPCLRCVTQLSGELSPGLSWWWTGEVKWFTIVWLRGNSSVELFTCVGMMAILSVRLTHFSLKRTNHICEVSGSTHSASSSSTLHLPMMRSSVLKRESDILKISAELWVLQSAGERVCHDDAVLPPSHWSSSDWLSSSVFRRIVGGAHLV